MTTKRQYTPVGAVVWATVGILTAAVAVQQTGQNQQTQTQQEQGSK